MWVTQTYLGSVEPEAQLFVYYLFENYDPAQTDFTNHVQTQLEKLGETFRSSVSLLMPNPRYAVAIGAELRGIQDFWWTLKGKLPGLLIATTPLTTFDTSKGEYCLIPFSNLDAQSAAETVERARAIVNQQLEFIHKNQPRKAHYSVLNRFINALELKPGFAGIRLDLRKLGKGSN